jgi:hypothetical protein
VTCFARCLGRQWVALHWLESTPLACICFTDWYSFLPVSTMLCTCISCTWTHHVSHSPGLIGVCNHHPCPAWSGGLCGYGHNEGAAVIACVSPCCRSPGCITLTFSSSCTGLVHCFTHLVLLAFTPAVLVLIFPCMELWSLWLQMK